MKQIDYTLEVDPKTALAVGRNGTHKIKAVRVWTGDNKLFIDCIGTSGKVLNAGLIIPENKRSELAEALLGDFNS